MQIVRKFKMPIVTFFPKKILSFLKVTLLQFPGPFFEKKEIIVFCSFRARNFHEFPTCRRVTRVTFRVSPSVFIIVGILPAESVNSSGKKCCQFNETVVENRNNKRYPNLHLGLSSTIRHIKIVVLPASHCDQIAIERH